MSNSAEAFRSVEEKISQLGVDAGLDELVARLREQGQHHELFEALKMQVRHSLGLSVLYNDSGDELEADIRQRLEEGLLAACREVGLQLLQAGKIRDGWTYLRPVDNKAEAAEQLRKIEPSEENLDELIEISLHEGVDPSRGYQLILDHHGTCNAITAYDTVVVRLSLPERRSAAQVLVAHVHRELWASVAADVAQREGSSPDDQTLKQLIEDRSWLFGEYSYHIDTTHLASTVRCARVLHDEASLRLALDLTEYGRRLNSQFQYPGEEPFADHYPSHAMYLKALLGNDVEEAVAYFRGRAEGVDSQQHGTYPVEAFVELLDRLGRHREAIEAVISYAAGSGSAPAQLLPLLLDLSDKAGDFDRLVEFCREQEDLLGFATGLVQARERSRVTGPTNGGQLS